MTPGDYLELERETNEHIRECNKPWYGVDRTKMIYFPGDKMLIDDVVETVVRKFVDGFFTKVEFSSGKIMHSSEVAYGLFRGDIMWVHQFIGNLNLCGR